MDSSERKNSVFLCKDLLTCTRKWQFFGTKLFDIQVRDSLFKNKSFKNLKKQFDNKMVSALGYPDNLVRLAVCEEGVAILDQILMYTLEKYPYDSIVKCQVHLWNKLWVRVAMFERSMALDCESRAKVVGPIPGHASNFSKTDYKKINNKAPSTG